MDILKRHYTDISFPVSGRGSQSIYDHFSGTIPMREINKFLRQQQTYQRLKILREPREYTPTLTRGPRDLYQIDLVDLTYLEKANKATKYLLICICTFSKFVAVEPLKSKQTREVLEATRRILSRMLTPTAIAFDQGKEFNSGHFLRAMKKMKIKVLVAKTKIKCSVVERVNQTIERAIHFHLLERGTLKYIDILQKIVGNYNRTFHSTTGLPPVDGMDIVNQRKILHYMQRKKNKWFKPKKPPLFKVGEKVRVYENNELNKRSYKSQFSSAMYIVHKVNSKRRFPTYLVKHGETGKIKQFHFRNHELIHY